MNNEKEQRQENAEVEESENVAEVYTAELERLRNETVDRREYDKLLKENRTLANSLATNFRSKSEEPDPVNVEEIKKRLFNPNPNTIRTDLDFFKDALSLRREILERSGDDIFLPHNHEYSPTETDKRDAERIASILEECVEYSEGDPGVFTARLKTICKK